MAFFQEKDFIWNLYLDTASKIPNKETYIVLETTILKIERKKNKDSNDQKAHDIKEYNTYFWV